MKREESDVRFAEGSAIKSLGGGLYEAMAVALGDAPDCDLEVFDENMGEEEFDLDRQKYLKLMFAHGQDPKIGKRRLAKADFEFLPRVGVKIQWRFEQPRDPVVRDIARLCDEGGMAISTAAVLTEKRKEARFTRIIRWPIYEASLTSSACAISGRTRVSAAKSAFESLSFDELVRRSGMSEIELLMEQSFEARHRALVTLGEKCGGTCCAECNDGWLQHQRESVIRYNADIPERIERRDVNLTASEAKAALKRAQDLFAKTEKYAAEVETERARLHLGPGIPYRHLEDWIAAGQKSGFIKFNARW